MQLSLRRFFQHKSVNFSGFHMLRITMAVGPSWFRKLLICKKVFAFSYIFTHISRFYRILISFSFEANSSGIFFASCFSASPSSSWRMSLVNTPAHRQQRFKDVYVFVAFKSKCFWSSTDLPSSRPWPWWPWLWPPLHPHHDRLLLYGYHGLGILLHVSGQLSLSPSCVNNGSYSGHEKRIAMDQLYHRTSHWILHKPLFH